MSNLIFLIDGNEIQFEVVKREILPSQNRVSDDEDGVKFKSSKTQ